MKSDSHIVLLHDRVVTKFLPELVCPLRAHKGQKTFKTSNSSRTSKKKAVRLTLFSHLVSIYMISFMFS